MSMSMTKVINSSERQESLLRERLIFRFISCAFYVSAESHGSNNVENHLRNSNTVVVDAVL